MDDEFKATTAEPAEQIESLWGDPNRIGHDVYAICLHHGDSAVAAYIVSKTDELFAAIDIDDPKAKAETIWEDFETHVLPALASFEKARNIAEMLSDAVREKLAQLSGNQTLGAHADNRPGPEA